MKEIVIKALKTFVETAIALFVAGLAGVDFMGENWQNVLVGLAISAGAGALSAVWNGVIKGLTAKEAEVVTEGEEEEEITEESESREEE